MNNEEKMLAMLETVIQGQTRMESDISELRQGQAVLERETSRISTDQALLRLQMDRLDRNQATLEQGQSRIRTDIAELKSDVSDIKQEQARINIIIENDIKKSIVLLVEGHMSLVANLDRLCDLNEQVIELKTDTSALKSVTRDLALKVAE